MEYPEFDICHWYAKLRVHELGLTDKITHHHCMGEAISIVTTKLLTDGIASSYPSTDYNLGPMHRFQVLQVNLRNPENYLIKDSYLEKDTDIPKSWLEDPKFDLVGWYRCYVNQQGLFEKKYCEAHLELHQKSESADVGPSEESGKLDSLSPSVQEDEMTYLS